MKRISLFITDPQYRHFQELGTLRDRPAAELIREALDRYLLEQQRYAPLAPAGTAPKPAPRRPARRTR